jgi:hypothetical protein
MDAPTAQDIVQGALQLPHTDALLLGVPITTGLVEMLKRSGLPDRYASIAALVVAVGVIALLVEEPVARDAVVTAIATGLAASGLYDNYRLHVARERRPNRLNPLDPAAE